MQDPIKGPRWVPYLGLVILALAVLGAPLTPFEKFVRLIRHVKWHLP